MLAHVEISAQTTSREYQIKAAFLFSFTQFIEWPDNAYDHSSAPFIIGILGEDPFGPVIDQTVAGEKVNGHPIIIERYATVKDMRKCHIIFISKKVTNPEEVISALSNSKTLTVSDNSNFSKHGGMIMFMMQQNKTRFEINLSVAKASDIRISSKLLSVAQAVR